MAQLVFQTAFPGDLLLSIPLIRRVKLWDSKAPVVLACRPGLGEFFLKEKLVDEVIQVDKKSTDRGESLLKELQSREWTNIFCPHQSLRTQVWMRTLKVKNAKVGFSSALNIGRYTHQIPRREKFPDALRQLSLLGAVDPQIKSNLEDLSKGSSLDNLSSLNGDIDFSQASIPEWATMTIKRRNSDSRIICLAPGSVWATKRWEMTGFIELGNLLADKGYTIQLVGSPAEKILCEQIAREIPDAENMAGKTSLYEMILLLENALALVSNDSGAMHMAAISGVPTVAIFGPTTLELGYRPWQERAIVVQADLPCRPCGRHGAHQCPVGNLKCMKEITALNVMKALEKVLRPFNVPKNL